jgi:hypothetical protein
LTTHRQGVGTKRSRRAALEASDRKATTKNLYRTMARRHIVGSRIGARPLDS